MGTSVRVPSPSVITVVIRYSSSVVPMAIQLPPHTITTVATLTLLPPMLISPVVVLLMVLVMSITTHSLSDRIPGIPPFGTATNNTMVLSVIQTHSIHTILSAIMLVEPNPTPDDNLSEPISQP